MKNDTATIDPVEPVTEANLLDALAAALEHSSLSTADLLGERRKYLEGKAKSAELMSDERKRESGQVIASVLQRHPAAEAVLDTLAMRPAPSIIETQRVKLGAMVEGGLPPIKYLYTPTLGEDIFYAEASFIVSGHKKSGKSLAMFTAALDRVRAGQPSVYLDLENGSRIFARRLELLGASPAAVDEHFHYVPFPRGLTLDTLWPELEGIAERTPGALVLVDSLRALLLA